MSLRRRMLMGFLIVAVALVVTNAVLARAFENDLLDRTDGELLDTTQRPIFTPDRGPGGGPRELQPLSDLYIAAANADGTRIVRLGRGLDEDQSPPVLTGRDLVEQVNHPFTVPSADGEGSWRVVAVQGRVENGLLVVATDLAGVDATLRRMWVIQLVGSALVLSALAAVLWWVLRLGVRPLISMAATADEIAAGDLSRRVEQADQSTEAGRLGVAFNSMVDGMEQALAEREATEARLRRFAADASHELRTPLTSIRGYAELWEAGGLRDPAQLDQAMRRLSDEGRRMGALVEDLLLLARLDQEPVVRQELVRLDLLAADAVADALAVEPGRPLDLETEPAIVVGDESQLRQLVSNLVTNARVHTPAGTPITVRVRVESSTARLEVSDQGPGMEPEVAQRVFERFYRGDAARGREGAGGTGLGLSIVDAVAEAHEGRASVESSPGRGSRFVVELPAAGPSAGDAPSD